MNVNNLPNEILDIICKNLSYRDLNSLGATCNKLNDFINSNSILWKNAFLLQDFKKLEGNYLKVSANFFEKLDLLNVPIENISKGDLDKFLFEILSNSIEEIQLFFNTFPINKISEIFTSQYGKVDYNYKTRDLINLCAFLYPHINEVFKNNGVPLENIDLNEALNFAIENDLSEEIINQFKEKEIFLTKENLSQLAKKLKQLSRSDNTNSYLKDFFNLEIFKFPIEEELTQTINEEVKYEREQLTLIKNLMLDFSLIAKNPSFKLIKDLIENGAIFNPEMYEELLTNNNMNEEILEIVKYLLNLGYEIPDEIKDNWELKNIYNGLQPQLKESLLDLIPDLFE